MRPAILDRLFAPVTALSGIGPQLAKLFERLAGPLVVDLVWHLPSGIVDRRASPPIREIEHEQTVTIRVRVEAHEPGGGRRPYRIFCTDGTGTLTLVYFNVKSDYLVRLLPIGAERVVSGRVERTARRCRWSIPTISRPDAADRLSAIEPVYPLTAGLAPRIAAEGGRGRHDRAPDAGRMARPGLLPAAPSWPTWRDAAVRPSHAPASEADLAPSAPARERLAYDELLASQLAVALVRARRHGSRAARSGDGRACRDTAERRSLYADRRRSARPSAEIAADMAQPRAGCCGCCRATSAAARRWWR